MATYRVLYWRDVPTQIRAEDDQGEVSLELPPRFMERIDALATEQGYAGTDAYLDQWAWSEERKRPGSAREVAEAVKAELEANADW